MSGIDFGTNNLAGGKFAGQNLTNASFSQIEVSGSIYIEGIGQVPYVDRRYANLGGADFTGADIRGAQNFTSGGANLIGSDGHIGGLDLNAGGLLVVRNFRNYWGFPTPFPITVDQHLAMGPGGTLRMMFEADAWDSTISFAPGIPVTLGGTLELTFTDEVNLASQIGRTFDLFDWAGVTPTGAFTVSSPYTWDLSKLYTTGEVTLSNVPGLLVLGDFNRDGLLTAADIQTMLSALTDLHSYEAAKGLSDAALVLLGDLNGDHAVTNADIQPLLDLIANAGGGAAQSVPEPASLFLLVIGAWAMIVGRRHK